MNDTQKVKVEAFLHDAIMSDTIKEVILNSFLKPRGDKDIHTLAAARIAIDLLEEAWKDLQRLKVETPPEKITANPGL